MCAHVMQRHARGAPAYVGCAGGRGVPSGRPAPSAGCACLRPPRAYCAACASLAALALGKFLLQEEHRPPPEARAGDGEQTAAPDDAQASRRVCHPTRARQYQGYLKSRATDGKTVPRAVHTRMKWLAREAGLPIACFSTTGRSARHAAAAAAAESGNSRPPKPARPMDPDMVAHLEFAVADETLPMNFRLVVAMFLFGVHGVHRYITLQRLGELSSHANGFFITGGVAADYKKAEQNIFTKAFCACRFTFHGYDYGALLVDGLIRIGMDGHGFVLVDFVAPRRSADPFEIMAFLKFY